MARLLRESKNQCRHLRESQILRESEILERSRARPMIHCVVIGGAIRERALPQRLINRSTSISNCTTRLAVVMNIMTIYH